MENEMSNLLIEGYNVRKSFERLHESAAQFAGLLEKVQKHNNRAWACLVVFTISALMTLAMLVARI